MTATTHGHVLTACFHFLPALVWAVVAERFWYRLRARREGHVFRFLVLLSALMALHFTLHGAIELTPGGLGIPGLHRTLLFLITVCVVGAGALFRHLVPLLAIREEPPSRRWLCAHYGIAALVIVVDGPIRLLLDSRGGVHPWLLSDGYFAVIVVLSVLAIRRLARRGAWPWQFDAAFIAASVVVPAVLAVAAVLGLGNVLLAPVFTPQIAAPRVSLLAHTTFGLVTAAPFAVMMLAEVLRGFLVAAATLAAAALVYLRLPAAVAGIASPEARALADLGAIAALGLLLPSGRAWLGDAIDRILFRQSRRAREELQAFVHTLAPELGPLECCRRALAEVMRVMEPRGTAILLAGGAEPIRCGEFALEPLEHTWPGADGASLPARAFNLYAVRDPSLREALAAAAADLVVPIVSPRGRRGHLFLSEGLLARATQAEPHVETLEAFAAQLALVLDAADLLARALAVERTLAHAEKLAAIGETAARIAHEIRNPVTAARSLAQQLARDPTAAVNAEHAHLILAELERVERQVAALLRFARREDFRFEPVDLGELVRATLTQFRPRLEAAGIDLGLELPAGITPLADREKLRQVLVNLLENALDALRTAPERRLVLAVGTLDGSATLSVRDSGPGVPADALPRLFEPFFSLKEGGTGLGLAIAKRTVEAHGGRIEAGTNGGVGMSFQVALPLAAAGQSNPPHGRSGCAAAGGRTS